MTRLFTLIYLVYAFCFPAGSMSGITFEQYYGEQLPAVQFADSSTNVPEAAGTGTDIKAEEFSEELESLGFLKDENKDKKLNLRNGVIRFQSNCNMAVTGKWNEDCLNALINRFAAPDYEFSDIVTAPPSNGDWITINKTRRILTLYHDRKAVVKYPVAIGNPPSLTPEGRFTIVSKVKNPVWGGGGYSKAVKGGSPDNPLGYRWMGLSYKDGDTLGIHGNNSPYSIGKNISHGCIRMINQDVEELFERISRSTPVLIGNNTTLAGWGVIQEEYCSPVEPEDN